MPRTTFRGAVTDTRTAAMLKATEKLLGHKLRIAQGSYRTSVAASGQTHAKGAVVDVATKYQGFSRAEKLAIVAALRRVGFAAWLRPETPGVWGEHIHAVAIGGPMSDAAQRQVDAYLKGYDGLAGEGGKRPDPQASLGVKPTTWEQYRETLLPQAGRASVTAFTFVRKEPSRTARKVKARKAGDPVWFRGTRVVVDPKEGPETWLRLVSGNWILAKRTTRGE